MYSVNDLPAVSRKDCVSCSVEGGGSASRGSRFSNVCAVMTALQRRHLQAMIRLHEKKKKVIIYNSIGLHKEIRAQVMVQWCGLDQSRPAGSRNLGSS